MFRQNSWLDTNKTIKKLFQLWIKYWDEHGQVFYHDEHKYGLMESWITYVVCEEKKVLLTVSVSWLDLR